MPRKPVSSFAKLSRSTLANRRFHTLPLMTAEHSDIQKNDSLKVNLVDKTISSVYKFVNGASVYLTGGNNIGRIGVLQSVEKHPGSFDIAHVKDSAGNTFATRVEYVFVIGDGKSPAISIPKGDGLKLSLIEERDAKIDDEEDEVDEEDD